MTADDSESSGGDDDAKEASRSEVPPNLPGNWQDEGIKHRDNGTYREFVNRVKPFSVRFDTDVCEVFLLRINADDTDEWTPVEPITARSATHTDEAVSLAHHLMTLVTEDEFEEP